MGIALLATAWSSHRGITDASDTLVRGQTDLLARTFRARTTELGHPPAPADLEAFLSDQREQGLRYIATLDDQGAPMASAGTPLGSPGVDATLPERRGETVPVGN